MIEFWIIVMAILLAACLTGTAIALLTQRKEDNKHD